MLRRPGSLLLSWYVLLQLAALCPAAKPDGPSPNILFCFADDWGRYASAYREPGEDTTPNSIVETPHFDRVAREGVLFRHAFVNAPSCTPCRSALLSGQYFFRTGRGAILQGARWDAAIPTFPRLLRAHGYHVGFTYKVWSPGEPRDAPYGDAEHRYEPAGKRFNRFSQIVFEADDPTAAKGTLYNEVLQNFRGFLRDRKADQPFCYWFGPTNCHRKWTPGSGKALWGLEPQDLQGKLPPFLPDVEVVREDFCDYLGEVQAFDAAVGILLAELEQTGELERTLVVISGDHGAPGFPRGKCNLYDFGVQVALAVRWGDRVPGGRTVDDFVNLMDLAPTFLRATGAKVPEVMTGHSLVPLLTSTAAGQVEPARDAVIVGRERHVRPARTGQLPYPQRAIRTRDFLYVHNFKPDRWPMGTAAGYGQPAGPLPDVPRLANETFAAFADLDASPTKAWIVKHCRTGPQQHYWDFAFGRRPQHELYDLRSDPHQLDNIAENPQYAAIRNTLEQRLLDTLQEANDPRVLGDGSTFDRPPYAGQGS